MSRLLISFAPETDEDRVSARLRRIADLRGEATHDDARDIRVLAGHSRTIEAEPGHYLLEVCWRDGNITTCRSFVQELESTEFLLTSPRKKRRTQTAARDFSQPSAGGMFRGLGRTVPQGESYAVFSSEQAAATWTLLRDRAEIERLAPISSEGRPLHRLEDVTVQLGEGSARSWLVYWACDHWSVSSLPTAASEEAPTVLRFDPNGLPFVAVTDPDMRMMTDMLPGGDAEAARRYASTTYKDLANGDIQQMISARPLEICAFAYADYENSSESSWGSTLKTLADYHPWLSDVCVILGWQNLMKAKDESGWVTAGQLFERAVEAGVPYYSLGVRLLAEGLTMLAIEAPQHEASAKLVCSLAAKIVRSEAFTTISF